MDDRFHVGDCVAALPESDLMYGITNYRNDYRGYVVKVHNSMITVADKPDGGGRKFSVDPKYFEKVTEQDSERDLVPPETDLFAALF